jgi:hypothetical protein
LPSEFSHAYDFIDNFDDKKFMIQSHNKRKIIPPYYYKNLKLILSAFKGKDFDFEDSDKNYKAANIAISKLVPAKMTPEDFIRTVEYIFSLDFVWPKSYGGKAWVRICKGWQHLATSKTLNDMMIWIDHCYDLQHNTGSIFIKLKEYYNNDSAYDWINYALDKKRDLKSPYAIWDDVSSQMRELAGFALKRSKGSTKERYDTVEKPEADQARQELKKLKNANKPKYKKPTDKPKPVTVYHRDGSYTIYRAFLSKHPYHALEFSAYQIEPPNSNEPSFIGSIVSVSKGKFVVRPLATMSGEEIVKAKLKEYPLKSIITKYEFGVENYTPKVT